MNTADIVIFGADPSARVLIKKVARRDVNFTAIIFHRTSPEITAPGGPWDTSKGILPSFGFAPRSNHAYMDWRNHASGSAIRFKHIQDLERYKGSHFTYMCWHELTSFAEEQFTYLLSRNRSPSGCNARPRIWATASIGVDSWVDDWIAPWCDFTHPLFNSVEYGDKLHFRRSEDETPDSIKPYVLYRAPDGQMTWVTKDCPLARTITFAVEPEEPRDQGPMPY